MFNVPAKFASVFLFGAAAGAVWTMLPQRAVLAADNCVTVPTDQTPQGQHWYYHIERGTGRHCWYLRGRDEKSARTDTPVTVAPEPSAPRRVEAAPPSRSIADAHAEIPPRARVPGEAPATTSQVWPGPASAPPPPAGAAQTPALTEPAPSLASRWPKASETSASGGSGTAPITNQATASQEPPAVSLMLADVQSADATTNAGSDGAQIPPPVLADRNNIGSVQKLLLVAAGALALAGLTGSAVYRLGRRRRRNDWLRERTAWKSAQNPNTPPWLEPRFANTNTIPDLDEARLAVQESDFSLAMSEGDQMAGSEGDQMTTSESDQAVIDDRDQPMTSEGDQIADNVEKIEEFLARLTRKLEDENAKRTQPAGRRVMMVAPHGEDAPSAVPEEAEPRHREHYEQYEDYEALTSPVPFERRARARS